MKHRIIYPLYNILKYIDNKLSALCLFPDDSDTFFFNKCVGHLSGWMIVMIITDLDQVSHADEPSVASCAKGEAAYPKCFVGGFPFNVEVVSIYYQFRIFLPSNCYIDDI